MKKSGIVAAVLLTGFLLCAQAVSPCVADAGPLKEILFYVPNRVFDLLDIFRLRVRVGPGLSVGARATKPASVFIGRHQTLYCGLPGPRGSRTLPLPVWFESASGPQISFADMGRSNTHYGMLEVGGEMQLFIIGFNIGIDVFEIADFATGLVTIDIAGDDF
jgi:hypothetical protein